MSKFSYILLGLVATFSSFVLFTVHLGTTQAFVSAQTSIGLDLGTGFPGTSLTDSFTIVNTDNDTADYTITLAANTTGAIDIRPFRSVWKDDTEIDVDGPIVGYSGTGNFTAGSDWQDKWFVRFDVPDVTLSPGTVLEYDCRIVIEPEPD